MLGIHSVRSKKKMMYMYKIHLHTFPSNNNSNNNNNKKNRSSRKDTVATRRVGQLLDSFLHHVNLNCLIFSC